MINLLRMACGQLGRIEAAPTRKIRIGRNMMISIGHKHFIESNHIVEILKASDTRVDRLTHPTAERGMLIDASDGRKVKSIIKLKSNHTVLSALGVETLRSRIGNIFLPSASGNKSRLSHKHKNTIESKPSDFENRRIEPERRRFSYTRHIPERRSGVERRSKDL